MENNPKLGGGTAKTCFQTLGDIQSSHVSGTQQMPNTVWGVNVEWTKYTKNNTTMQTTIVVSEEKGGTLIAIMGVEGLLASHVFS